MKELLLKYGCNPQQKPARIYTVSGDLPLKILNGNPSYINLLDALNGWQLVKELKEATGLAAAASFKHTSPAGAAVAVPLTDVLMKEYFVQEDNLTDIAAAYIRARGADRMSSYGDFAALSEECDVQTAKYLAGEFSDGIMAPSYSGEALELLMNKRKGNYLIIQMEPDYIPGEKETREVFGITFEQQRNDIKITEALLNNIPSQNKLIPQAAKRDLMISLIILKYTQSNSVCYVKDGQAIGIGAGQQSRIHCTRLAGNKADAWFLRQNPKVTGLPFKENLKKAEKDNGIDRYISDDYMDILADGMWETVFTKKPEPFAREERTEWLKGLTGAALGSDAYFPFGDNIERAAKSGVAYIAQPGGSIRDAAVIEACDKYNIAMAFTGLRLFYH
ncbi:phosphoribosylaminoimidazolecarboxamide formyltransferase [Anaerocolumna jejuensis]|uniref:phosphoribosylaminoimidazolecarboxamide formyltransferase n=1 Tax=Anaerocolumna jejuensis TaxID=259063 RepID=UPI003F7B685B